MSAFPLIVMLGDWRDGDILITAEMLRAGIDALISYGYELPYAESALERILVEVFSAMAANDQTRLCAATKHERIDLSAKGRP
jgi:hypothetical protein